MQPRLQTQIVSDWKTKADGLSQELDTSQRECRLGNIVKMINIIMMMMMMIMMMLMMMRLLLLCKRQNSGEVIMRSFSGIPLESCSGSKTATRSA